MPRLRRRDAGHPSQWNSREGQRKEHLTQLSSRVRISQMEMLAAYRRHTGIALQAILDEALVDYFRKVGWRPESKE